MYSLAAAGKTNRKGMPNPLRLAVIANSDVDDVRLPQVPHKLQKLELVLGVGRRRSGPASCGVTATAVGSCRSSPIHTHSGCSQSAPPLDRGWDVVQLAVDSQPGSAQLHIGALPVTSSLLETRTNIASFHSWAFEVVGSEDVAVDTLDGLAARLGLEPRRGYLKLDVQGLELRALRGAATVLQRLAAVEIEVNLMPLYRGQPRFDELLTLLAAASFRLGAVTPGSVEPSTGLMGHVDAVFVRDA